jgi:pilus assembly protein Flp/PilA
MKKLALSRLVARKQEAGVTMIEYALLAALISVAAVSVLVLISPEISSTFQKVLDGLLEASASN